MRENVVSRIKSIVQQLWPNARLKNYGSFSYGLTLPTGDIDIMILENGNKSLIRSLAAQIRSSNIAQANSIQVKDDLRIPIIEFIERESKINIDMPFLNEPTLKVAALLNGYKDEYPVFVKLVIVLKQFLGQRGLNDVFIGEKKKSFIKIGSKKKIFLLQMKIFVFVKIAVFWDITLFRCIL